MQKFALALLAIGAMSFGASPAMASATAIPNITVDGSNVDYDFDSTDNFTEVLNFNLPSSTATYYLYVDNNGPSAPFTISSEFPSKSIFSESFASNGTPLTFSPDSSGNWSLNVVLDPASLDVVFSLDDQLLANPPFPPSATPLPSTWTMLIAGFLGLGFFAYRGSKRNSVLASA